MSAEVSIIAPRPSVRPSTPPPRRVVIATINRLSGDTGVHTHTRAIQEGLTASGTPCRVIGPFSGGAHWLPVFALRYLVRPLNRSWSTRWYRHWHRLALRENLIRALATAPADVVLAQCPVSANAALDVRSRLGGSFAVAMVCHFNFSEANEYRQKGELSDQSAYNGVLEFERRALREVDRVIYVSDWARKVVEEERGIQPRATSVIWNGIPDLPGIQPVPRQTLGLDEYDLVLMNVGTLEPRKNQLGLIDLFAAVSQRYPKAKLVLVGSGPDRPQIRRRIRLHRLEDKVLLLGRRRDVPALLSTADAYIHYASLENCPVALLEAARAALPIAAIPSGGSAELLAMLGGVALDPENIASSVDRLAPILSHADYRRQIGQWSRQRFLQSFTRDAMIAGYRRELGLTPVAAGEVRR